MQIMTAQEAADYLRVALDTVRRLVSQGKIPGRKVGGQWRFDKKHLDKWMREQAKARREDK